MKNNLPPEKVISVLFAIMAAFMIYVTVKVFSVGMIWAGTINVFLVGFVTFLSVWTWRQE